MRKEELYQAHKKNGSVCEPHELKLEENKPTGFRGYDTYLVKESDGSIRISYPGGFLNIRNKNGKQVVEEIPFVIWG